jgi:hypothetical protein
MRANDGQQAGVWDSSGTGAHPWCCGGLTVSDAYADDQYQPTDGIYAKGIIRTGNEFRAPNSGTKSDPGYTWEGDDDCGLYLHGANVPAIASYGKRTFSFAYTGNWSHYDLNMNQDEAGTVLVGGNKNKIKGAGDIDCENLYSYGDVVCNYSSDSRMKDNQEPIKNALEDISKLNGTRFIWNHKGPQPLINKLDMGVIAQDVEKVYPELVTTRDNGDLGVNYNGLIPVLIEAVKELKGTVDKFKEANQVALDKIIELESIIRRSDNGR